MDAGWAAIIGGIVGGAAATCGQFIVIQTQRVQSRRTVAYALAAEIENVLNNSERRNYERDFSNLLEQWKRGQNLDVTINISGLRVELEPVAAANLDKIGFLAANDATDLVRFYSQLVQINGTIKSLGDRFWPTPQARTLALETELETWALCKATGRDLVDRLRKY